MSKHTLGPLCVTDEGVESLGCLFCGTSWIRQTVVTDAASDLLKALEAICILGATKQVGHAQEIARVAIAKAEGK